MPQLSWIPWLYREFGYDCLTSREPWIWGGVATDVFHAPCFRRRQLLQGSVGGQVERVNMGPGGRLLWGKREADMLDRLPSLSQF